MAVEVVLALLGEELDGAVEALPGLDGMGQLRVGQAGIQQIGLPPQLGGGVGVGVGHQGVPVQGGAAVVHGRVGGQPGLQGVDVG